jgi:hypothetical protein
MRRRLLLTLLLATGVCTPLGAQSDAGLRFRIGQDTVIDGVRCGRTGRAYAVIYESGRLDECPIAADTVIAGHHFPHGTWIRLTDDGVLKSVWLLAPLTVQGLPCRGTGFKGWAVTFHRSGRLSLCYLDEMAMIDGVPCAAATFLRELTGNSGVSLREDGRLNSCRLGRDFVYGGMPHKKGSRFTLPER